MTTLVAWIVYTTTGEKPELPRALYIASDSRITWGSDARRWDAGRKIFSPTIQPHLFGYCGDVVFPSLALAQVISAIDQNILFDAGDAAEVQHQIVLDTLKTSFHRRHDAPDRNFSIVHGVRERPWPETSFAAWLIDYHAVTDTWRDLRIPIPRMTAVLRRLGSGTLAAEQHAITWEKSDVAGTSRAVFSAFCDSLASGQDPLSGGAPQLSALYTSDGPRTIGIVRNEELFLHGLQVKEGERLGSIEWRDQLFRRIDPLTRKLLPGARDHVRPAQT